MKIRKEKIVFFEKVLLDFFRKAGREHLPWRKKKITAYEVWVAEVMLQQTQVSRVTGYYERFLKQFPTIQKLAEVSWEEFLPYYQGLGYYTRGRNILETAKMIVKKYKGKFPREKKLLEGLPGIGPYTAAAIMSFAYGQNEIAWDTNVRRVIGRFFFGSKEIVGGMNVWNREFKTSKKTLNAALMDFGSALCVNRPKCEACALRNRCVYYQEEGKQEKKLTTNNLPVSPTHQGGRLTTEKGINWGEAEIILFLHENHRKYYSADEKKFRPFILPAGYNTRAGIKNYFQEKYQLTLSVRPPHKKVIIKGKPIFFVNAQILLGEPAFWVFPKKARKEYNEKPGHFLSEGHK